MEENTRKNFSPIRDAPSSVKLAGDEAKDRLYEPKNKKKLVRVLTVIAYMFSVSLAAIMLSMYYILLWSPSKTDPVSSTIMYPPCQVPDPIVMEQLSKQTKQQPTINNLPWNPKIMDQQSTTEKAIFIDTKDSLRTVPSKTMFDIYGGDLEKEYPGVNYRNE